MFNTYQTEIEVFQIVIFLEFSLPELNDFKSSRSEIVFIQIELHFVNIMKIHFGLFRVSNSY